MAQYLSSSTICWEGLFIDRYIAHLDINCLQYLHQKVLYTSLFLRNTYTPKKSQKMCFSCHIVMPPSVAALPSSVVLGCCDPDPLTFGVKQECLLFRHFQRTDGLFGASWQDRWGPVTFKTTIEKKHYRNSTSSTSGSSLLVSLKSKSQKGPATEGTVVQDLFWLTRSCS